MRSGRGLFVSREGLEYKGDFSKNVYVEQMCVKRDDVCLFFGYRCRDAQLWSRYHGQGVLRQDGAIVSSSNPDELNL